MNLKLKSHLLVKDIKFWILLFFLMRMYGITFPPLEVGHNWRQTDGLMIARNFYEHSPDIFYPTTDMSREKTGIVGCEFPILNYFVYLASIAFGYTHWYGRLIVLLFSSLGVAFFYKLIKPFFGERAALNASILLMSSLWFSYSRKNIPDIFSASLCIISLYYAFQYLESGSIKHVLLFFILGVLGCSSKILSATILTVLLIPILNPIKSLKRKMVLSVFSLIILLAVVTWYFLWVPYLNQTFGLGDQFFMGMSFSEGMTAIWENGAMVLKRITIEPLKYSGLIVFIAAMVLIITKKNWIPLLVFLLPFTSYLILLIKTGASIIVDNYYILVAIPSIAFIIGYGLTLMKNNKLAIALLIIISIESIANQFSDFRIRQPYKSLADLEIIMNKFSKSNDLIVINSEPNNPTAMYFAHRRGWGAPNDMLLDSSYLDDLRSKKCKYAVIVKQLYGDVNLNLPVTYDSEYFKVYALN